MNSGPEPAGGSTGLLLRGGLVRRRPGGVWPAAAWTAAVSAAARAKANTFNVMDRTGACRNWPEPTDFSLIDRAWLADSRAPVKLAAEADRPYVVRRWWTGGGRPRPVRPAGR